MTPARKASDGLLFMANRIFFTKMKGAFAKLKKAAILTGSSHEEFPGKEFLMKPAWQAGESVERGGVAKVFGQQKIFLNICCNEERGWYYSRSVSPGALGT